MDENQTFDERNRIWPKYDLKRRRASRSKKPGARGSSSVSKLTFLLVLAVPSPRSSDSVKPLPEGAAALRIVGQVAATVTQFTSRYCSSTLL